MTETCDHDDIRLRKLMHPGYCFKYDSTPSSTILCLAISVKLCTPSTHSTNI